jgi:hydrogenase nickel incorporation protein HypB
MRNKIEVIRSETKIMQANEVYADQVRRLLAESQTYCINLISSPGSGKTSLLVETLNQIGKNLKCAVIEGDQQTSNDAERIAATGVPVIQVNTLQSCHLNAEQILNCINKLPLDEIDLLIIENVGNLVCPASMDLGENEKVVLLSITEGEDKPEKYPLAFSEAKAMVLTKMDLLPHLKFDVARCEQIARSVKSNLQIIRTSAVSSDGLTEWLQWIAGLIQKIN